MGRAAGRQGNGSAGMGGRSAGERYTNGRQNEKTRRFEAGLARPLLVQTVT